MDLNMKKGKNKIKKKVWKPLRRRAFIYILDDKKLTNGDAIRFLSDDNDMINSNMFCGLCKHHL